jgi:hypothetical protein
MFRKWLTEAAGDLLSQAKSPFAKIIAAFIIGAMMTYITFSFGHDAIRDNKTMCITMLGGGCLGAFAASILLFRDRMKKRTTKKD